MQLTVIVTIVDGGETLERCLAGLRSQLDPPSMDVIVPFDDSVLGIHEIAARFPEYQYVDMGEVETARPKQSASGQHELFDRRRATGLALASGELVAMLEDRGVPRPEWARQCLIAHRRANQVIGGAIENGNDRLGSWAVYFCDFGRFQLPFEGGEVDYVSDINVCYKKSALERTRELWSDRFHETTVHWALKSMGEELYLDPDMVVEQIRQPVGLWKMLKERIAWGRLFAWTRCREVGRVQRLMWIAVSPLLPIVLYSRQARLRIDKGVNAGRFLQSSPLILVLLIAWSLGELMGYLTNAP